MKNKVVNIDKPELLQYFYPEYKIKSNIDRRDVRNKIIYNGEYKSGLSDYLEKNTKEYISLVGNVDYDLSKKENLVKFVYEEKGRRLTKKVKRSVDMLDWKDVVYCCKVFWLIDEWIYYIEEDELSMYSLFKAVVNTKKEMLDVYFKLLNKYPFYVIESSVITFLQRVKNIEEQNVSTHYYKVLQKADDKFGRGLKDIIFKYAKVKEGVREEIKLLNLLLDLG